MKSGNAIPHRQALLRGALRLVVVPGAKKGQQKGVRGGFYVLPFVCSAGRCFDVENGGNYREKIGTSVNAKTAHSGPNPGINLP